MDSATAAAVSALEQVAFVLERALQPSYRVKAFRGAAHTLAALPDGETAERATAGSLQELSGVGSSTAGVIEQVVAGEQPDYLLRVEREHPAPSAGEGAELLATLHGDLHSHSDWSDGGSPPREMARAARDLGHSYLALTDHSPRLTVANGLSPQRLRAQLRVVAELNEELAPFRLLTGIECDINADGTLDQEPELLAELDVVVASVHSKLTMSSEEMTARMVAAVANPHTDILGHCTGRNVMPRGRRGTTRPESAFDAEIVFEACRRMDVAVEVNCRPERLDPPRRLLRLAVETGCRFSIDCDAHAPGQLDWRALGADRAAQCGVTADRVVSSWSVADLLTWTGRNS